MKCFYHTDMDGKCSAAIVRKFYSTLLGSQHLENDESQSYVPINYNDEFPFWAINPSELVVIVDFSFKIGETFSVKDFSSTLVLGFNSVISNGITFVTGFSSEITS